MAGEKEKMTSNHQSLSLIWVTAFMFQSSQKVLIRSRNYRFLKVLLIFLKISKNLQKKHL